ncbi:ABC transporter permease [Streptomyces genisteinicus]|uniref:ABC transporter permease subunit n=1 Tax=Streptomyces genisteinicus TaxID=2768068 RepID=A0A7H0I520_9ACTN|nr:ABC transporter permease subunit [Streptomyces genisteinicus]QNP67886.1 ABC transporter permease subunit [Streptomyces genisteinicus]
MTAADTAVRPLRVRRTAFRTAAPPRRPAAARRPGGTAVRAAARTALRRGAAPVVSLVAVVCLWQLASALDRPAALPSPAAVGGEIAAAWADGSLAPAVLHSLGRCLLGFVCAVGVGAPLGMLLHRFTAARVTVAPALGAVQSLPAAALVPVAVLCLGPSDAAVLGVVLLGAVPPVATGVLGALDQVPPLLVRAGRSMGATGAKAARHVLLPAALPGVVAAVRQGWTFGWRALMTAELITGAALSGVGGLLDAGRRSGSLSQVLAATALILAVGVAVEVLVFRPVERRVLRARGLA